MKELDDNDKKLLDDIFQMMKQYSREHFGYIPDTLLVNRETFYQLKSMHSWGSSVIDAQVATNQYYTHHLEYYVFGMRVYISDFYDLKCYNKKLDYS